jgi:hypothetical protein
MSTSLNQIVNMSLIGCGTSLQPVRIRTTEIPHVPSTSSLSA